MGKKIKGQIGYCTNSKLGINKQGGHYVYIRAYDKKTGLCDVNVVTSLEKNGQFNNARIGNLKKGLTYSIPLRDADFTKWSGINHTPIRGVSISDVKDIGKKKIKNRHKFFIGKFF